jgi:hypothetical protein
MGARAKPSAPFFNFSFHADARNVSAGGEAPVRHSGAGGRPVNDRNGTMGRQCYLLKRVTASVFELDVQSRDALKPERNRI